VATELESEGTINKTQQQDQQMIGDSITRQKKNSYKKVSLEAQAKFLNN